MKGAKQEHKTLGEPTGAAGQQGKHSSHSLWPCYYPWS